MINTDKEKLFTIAFNLSLLCSILNLYHCIHNHQNNTTDKYITILPRLNENRGKLEYKKHRLRLGVGVFRTGTLSDFIPATYITIFAYLLYRPQIIYEKSCH
jgi:hypothetical protein